MPPLAPNSPTPAPVLADAVALAMAKAARRATVIDGFVFLFRAVLRWLYTLAVFGGCTYLVFWRGESGWLYLPACLLLSFRRGL